MSAIYVTDARHLLDAKGAIAAQTGPVRVLAQFLTGLIAYCTDYDSTGIELPPCFKCHHAAVQSTFDDNDSIIWRCNHCAVQGRLVNWRDTFWDLS